MNCEDPVHPDWTDAVAVRTSSRMNTSAHPTDGLGSTPTRSARQDHDAPSVPSTPIQMIVDSDGGVDDIAALWYLLEHSDVEIVGITACGGNVDVMRAADNLARVCQLAGAEIPIAPGEPGSFGPHPTLRSADFIHGADGVGDTGRRPRPWLADSRTCEDLVADLVGAAPDELVLLTLGPLTNVARWTTRRPDLVEGIGRVVVMGGTVAQQGNALPMGEANIAHDPWAAAAVATASWRWPPLLVGLDVTLAATLTDAEFELLEERRTPAAADLAEPLGFYRRHGGTFVAAGECPCHDLTAAIVAVEPDLVEAPLLPLGVDTSGGLAWGTTVVDRRRPFFERAGPGASQALPSGMADWSVALDIDVTAVRHRVRRLWGDDS